MVVLVCAPRAEWCAERLRETFPDVEFVAADTLSAARPAFAEAEVVICGSALTSEMVERMPRLRWVQSYISGTDEIMAALEQRPGVLLTSARGLHGPQMAEMALLHMLYLSRNALAMTINQRRREWVKVPQRLLAGKDVGIVGLGVIGTAIANACSALDMTVHGFSRTGLPADGVHRVLPVARLREAAPGLDFLVLAVPYSSETDRLVDGALLTAMKADAYLINLARGGVVDENALVAALRSGQIAGAGLDVVAVEPLPKESPLWQMDNVLITPHLAGQSDRYHEQLVPLLEHNIREYLAGQLGELLNVVPTSTDP